MPHILFVLQTKHLTILFGIFPENSLINQVGYLLILICGKSVNIFADCLSEILAIVFTLYLYWQIVPVAPVDVFGTTSGTAIDCCDNNIKYPRA